MDAVADSKDIVMELLHKLQEEFIVGMHYEHLVVEGDGKLYEILSNLNMEKNWGGSSLILEIGTCSETIKNHWWRHILMLD